MTVSMSNGVSLGNLVSAVTDPLTGEIEGLTSGGDQILVISASAPSDADGRPDGTIYIQTA